MNKIVLLLLLGILLSALQVNLYAEDKTEAEIIHWWYSGADAQAIAYLSEIYNNSGGLWYSSAKETYSVAREEVVSRLARGYPPTACLLYTSPSPRDATLSRMPSSA